MKRNTVSIALSLAVSITAFGMQRAPDENLRDQNNGPHHILPLPARMNRGPLVNGAHFIPNNNPPHVLFNGWQVVHGVRARNQNEDNNILTEKL